MTSRRLPGKVMLPIRNMPLLELMIRRVRKATLIREVIVATTTNVTDDPIVALCHKLGVGVHRGSEHDVLQRVVDAHRHFRSDLIVELTGDNPLQDPALIDQCVRYFMDNECSYVSNCMPVTEYPDGMNVQVFPPRVLDEVSRKTADARFHEHVSMYIYRSGEYNLGYVGPEDEELKWPELSFTVDTRAEYEFVKKVAEQFADLDFTVRDLVCLMRSRPDLRIKK